MTIAGTLVSGVSAETRAQEAAQTCHATPYSLIDIRSLCCRSLVQSLTTSDQVPPVCPFSKELLDRSADLGLPLVPVLTVKGFSVKRLVELCGNFRMCRRDRTSLVSRDSMDLIQCEACYSREVTSSEWLLMSTGFVPGTKGQDLEGQVAGLTDFVCRLAGVSSPINQELAGRYANEFAEFRRKIGLSPIRRAQELMNLPINHYRISLPQFFLFDALYENRHSEQFLPVGGRVWIRTSADSVSGKVMAVTSVGGSDGFSVGRVNPFVKQPGSGVLFALSFRS